MIRLAGRAVALLAGLINASCFLFSQTATQAAIFTTGLLAAYYMWTTVPPRKVL
jgi:hypothetical protein